MKKWILFLCFLMLLVFPAFAVSDAPVGSDVDEFLTEILISDVPVTYGDEAFRARILERTEGKRDPIGLVLTGGSARACAHIGVLKYLDEHGIVPDFIVSNSMGSIIGMLYAAGVTPSQIEEIMTVGDIASYFSLKLPSHGGFLDASGFRTLIDSLVGSDLRLEDTQIPCMVVCDDLISKREIRITEGRFTDILIGSFALPVYFPPMEYNGHLLIDGGVITLAPLPAAYDYSNTVIVSTAFYDPVNINLINPVTILNVSFDIGKRQSASSALKRYYDDMIWIRCGVESFSFMAFDKCEEMAAIGYASAAAVGDKLDSLYKSGQVIDTTISEAIAERVGRVRANLVAFGRITASKSSTMLGLNFVPFDSDSTTYYLKNSMSAGLEYKYIVGDFDMSVIAGFGADTQNLAESTSFLTAGGQISYYPIHSMRIKLESYGDFLRNDAGFKPLVYGRQSFDMHVLSEDSVKLSVHEVLEASDDISELTKRGVVLSLYANGSYLKDNYSLDYKVGYLLTGENAELNSLKNYAEAQIGGNLDINPRLVGSFSSLFRINLDGKGSVPLFLSDGYVSRQNGYGASGLYTDSALFNSVTNVNLCYSLGISPTFGEFLILDDPTVGLFGSALVTRDRYAISAGVSLKMTASLIGLIKLPMTLKIGYEYHEPEFKGVTASLVFSTAL